MATVIKMFYVLRDKATGKVLEDNSSNEVGFIVGRGQVLEKLEEKVVGLNEGEKAQFTLLCEDALGPRSEEAFQVVPKEQFAGIDLYEGMELFGEGEGGEMVRVIVKEISDEGVKVDFNHPYAGLDLDFEVTVTQKRDATAEEEISGRVETPHACGCGGGGCCGGGHHHH